MKQMLLQLGCLIHRKLKQLQLPAEQEDQFPPRQRKKRNQLKAIKELKELQKKEQFYQSGQLLCKPEQIYLMNLMLRNTCPPKTYKIP